MKPFLLMKRIATGIGKQSLVNNYNWLRVYADSLSVVCEDFDMFILGAIPIGRS
jgi:hypothetical protein